MCPSRSTSSAGDGPWHNQQIASGVSWAVGHKMEFRRRGWDKREEDYW